MITDLRVLLILSCSSLESLRWDGLESGQLGIRQPRDKDVHASMFSHEFVEPGLHITDKVEVDDLCSDWTVAGVDGSDMLEEDAPSLVDVRCILNKTKGSLRAQILQSRAARLGQTRDDRRRRCP